MKIKNYMLVCLGALPGTYLRWAIDDHFIVNVIGSFLIGILSCLPDKREMKIILIFGFCGSLTSFSGWIYEVFDCFLNRSLILDLS